MASEDTYTPAVLINDVVARGVGVFDVAPIRNDFGFKAQAHIHVGGKTGEDIS